MRIRAVEAATVAERDLRRPVTVVRVLARCLPGRGDRRPECGELGLQPLHRRSGVGQGGPVEQVQIDLRSQLDRLADVVEFRN